MRPTAYGAEKRPINKRGKDQQKEMRQSRRKSVGGRVVLWGRKLLGHVAADEAISFASTWCSLDVILSSGLSDLVVSFIFALINGYGRVDDECGCDLAWTQHSINSSRLTLQYNWSCSIGWKWIRDSSRFIRCSHFSAAKEGARRQSGTFWRWMLQSCFPFSFLAHRESLSR